MEGQIGSSGVDDTTEQGTQRGRLFSDNPDGPLLVPIPCAVLVVVIITTLILAIITLSVGKYNCPGVWEKQEPGKNGQSPVFPISCPEDWIGFRGKCYLFSNTSDTWNASKRHCSNHNATLTQVNSEKDLDFLKRLVGTTEHWIGSVSGTIQASDRTTRNPVNNGSCHYLKGTTSGQKDCQESLLWICSKSSTR
ncbi:early activation antigen CD69-like [Tachyglossus aculeatus]|uniref:early activation antigen CD69-like n=1 Tax=Tachyglossus aculeatus TaxID=9261 RepID=UPI0018F298A1|nr:early activation antigen CD69-like [Tachyglossus aculeatus]